MCGVHLLLHLNLYGYEVWKTFLLHHSSFFLHLLLEILCCCRSKFSTERRKNVWLYFIHKKFQTNMVVVLKAEVYLHVVLYYTYCARNKEHKKWKIKG